MHEGSLTALSTAVEDGTVGGKAGFYDEASQHVLHGTRRCAAGRCGTRIVLPCGASRGNDLYPRPVNVIHPLRRFTSGACMRLKSQSPRGGAAHLEAGQIARMPIAWVPWRPYRPASNFTDVHRLHCRSPSASISLRATFERPVRGCALSG